MSKQTVPWAVGRRALVLDHDGSGLMEVVGRVDEGVWEHWEALYDGQPQAEHGCATYPLPGQCLGCYEVGRHTPDCERGRRIAENRARGVPEAWVEWAMWRWPEPRKGVPEVYAYASPGLFILARFDKAMIGWRCGGLSLGGIGHQVSDGSWLVALGASGPDLSPWGIE